MGLNHIQILKDLSKAAGLSAIFAGCAVLAGWQFKITLLKSIFPNWISMAPNTAIAFILAGISLFLNQRDLKKSPDHLSKNSHTQKSANLKIYFANGCAWFIIVIGSITISEYIFNINLGVHQFLFKEENLSGILPPVKMAPATAIAFILTGIALLSLDFKANRYIILSEIMAFFIFFTTLPVILGYFYNAEQGYGITGYYKLMAWHTSATFIVLAFGILFARPNQGAMAVITYKGPGGTMARALLPAALLTTPALGWFRLQGELAGYYNTAFGLALFALLNMAIFVILIWINAYHLHKMDLERAAAETAEYTHRKLLETLIEFAPDAFIFVKSDGRIALINKKAEECFGYTRFELLGQFVETLLPEHLREIHVQHRIRYLSAPTSRSMGSGLKLAALRKNGTTFPIDLSLSPVHTSDGILVACIIRDITEREQAEEAMAKQNAELERSNTELERFAYVASHDLQEPLRMVSGYTQLIAKRYKGKLDSDADEFIAYAVDGAARMQRLINDLLIYSRVGSKGKPFELTNCETVFEEAVNNLQVAIEEKGAVITHEPLPVIKADKTQMIQLFQNLIGNSIKFKGDEPPKLHINAIQKNNEWLFSVKDNGIGIDTKYSERIFVIFQRLHTREEYPGTGIGLAICKKIVERHGGRIWIESTTGKGSTFYFTIPIRGDK